MKKLIILIVLFGASVSFAALGAVKTYYIVYRGQMLKMRTRNIDHQKIAKGFKAKYSKRDGEGKRIKSKGKKWDDPNMMVDYTHITRLPNWNSDPNDINDVEVE